MSTRFCWDTFCELMDSDPERGLDYRCEYMDRGWRARRDYEEGFAEGMAKALIWYLEKRFGAVPAALRERIFDAEIKTIDAWVDRAWSAQSLPALLEAN